MADRHRRKRSRSIGSLSKAVENLVWRSITGTCHDGIVSGQVGVLRQFNGFSTVLQYHGVNLHLCSLEERLHLSLPLLDSTARTRVRVDQHVGAFLRLRITVGACHEGLDEDLGWCTAGRLVVLRKRENPFLRFDQCLRSVMGVVDCDLVVGELGPEDVVEGYSILGSGFCREA